jgi:hypothetical protein
VPKTPKSRPAEFDDEPAFAAILDALGEAERHREAFSPLDSGAQLFASASAPLDQVVTPAPLREDVYFSFATDDVCDLRPSAAPMLFRPEDTTSIARELGLCAGMTPADLRQRRRKFMWENHPDRAPALSRDVANRRVAIANMLFDRAECKAAKR